MFSVMDQPNTLEDKVNRLLQLAEKNGTDMVKLDKKVDSFSEVSKKIPFMEADISILQEEIKNLRSEIRHFEKKANENNLVIFKVKDEEEFNRSLKSSVATLLHDIDKSSSVDDIVAVSRIGRTMGSRLIFKCPKKGLFFQTY